MPTSRKKSTEWICLLFLAVSGFSMLPQRGKRALRLQREKEATNKCCDEEGRNECNNKFITVMGYEYECILVFVFAFIQI